MSNLGLTELQHAWHGDVLGVELEETEEREGQNRLDIRLSHVTGELEVDIPEGLDIAIVNLTAGGWRVRAGDGETGRIEVRATYPTPDNPGQPVRFEITIASLTLDDIVATGPDSMAALAGVTVRDFHIILSELPIQAGEALLHAVRSRVSARRSVWSRTTGVKGLGRRTAPPSRRRSCALVAVSPVITTTGSPGHRFIASATMAASEAAGESTSARSRS